jgi:hypothetical protein
MSSDDEESYDQENVLGDCFLSDPFIFDPVITEDTEYFHDMQGVSGELFS